MPSPPAEPESQPRGLRVDGTVSLTFLDRDTISPRGSPPQLCVSPVSRNTSKPTVSRNNSRPTNAPSEASVSVRSFRSNGRVGVRDETAAKGRSTGNLIQPFDEQDDWWETRQRDHCGNRFVLNEGNLFRLTWNLAIFLSVVYTGTVFLFRVSFIEFRMGEPLSESPSVRSCFDTVDNTINVLFWIDLFLNFFFTFRDKHAIEVDSLRAIAREYMQGGFWVNLIACTPEALINETLNGTAWYDHDQNTNVVRSFRMARLQRISPLARLTRLTRLIKMVTTKPSSPAIRRWRRMRGVRIFYSALGLIWAVHILACGWYLCAALHTNPMDTWVARRIVDNANQVSLLERGPFDQWVNAFYFVLTVSVTVGFGDIAAVTTGEIIYVCFTMLMGAVVNGVIISEVINIVTTADKTEEYVCKQTELVEAFAMHTGIDETAQREMASWVSYSARGWATSRYDKEEMKQLITDKCMPRSLLGRLPYSLFGGRLLQNRLLNVRGGKDQVPPRLPLLIALSAQRSEYEAGDIVYQMRDHAVNVFLVLSGTFADIARPTLTGGVDEACPSLDDTVVEWVPTARAFALASPKSDDSNTARVASWYSNSPNVGAASPGRLSIYTTKPVQDQAQLFNKPRSSHLYPYRLYSGGAYFGFWDVLDGGERRSTLRCESDFGAVALVLHKPDLLRIMEEFPTFGMAWQAAARSQELHRVHLLATLTTGMTYRRLAAVRIQQRAKLFLAGVHLNRAYLAAKTFKQVKSACSPTRELSAASLGTNISQARMASLAEQHTRELRQLRAAVSAIPGEIAALRRELLLHNARSGSKGPASPSTCSPPPSEGLEAPGWTVPDGLPPTLLAAAVQQAVCERTRC